MDLEPAENIVLRGEWGKAPLLEPQSESYVSPATVGVAFSQVVTRVTNKRDTAHGFLASLIKLH